jgi:hypothetical protein
MLYRLDDPFRKHIEDITFFAEGGYMAKVKGDYETLFGLIAPNFNAKAVNNYIKALPPGEFEKLPKVVHDAFVSISHGGSPSPLMKHIGSMLKPITNSTIPGTHIPMRTNAQPSAGANVDEINAVKDFITFHYDQEYNAKLGFKGFPSGIRFRAMDMAINAAYGLGRANWALVKAMRESGILSAREFNSDDYPYITGDEASDKRNFAPGHKAEEYSSPAMTKRIADKLEHASKEQLELMEYNVDKWRIIFFQERAKDSPYIASIFDGLVNRIRKFGNFGRGAELAEKYANGHMDAQFTAPLKGYLGSMMDGEIAIEIPGKEGLLRYKVDMKTHDATKLVELPKGVRWVKEDGTDPSTGKHVKGGFDGYNTFIWKNHLGQEVRMPITIGLNESIGMASMDRWFGKTSINIPFTNYEWHGKDIGLPTSFARDATGLDNAQSAHLTLKTQVGRLPYIEVGDKDTPTEI